MKRLIRENGIALLTAALLYATALIYQGYTYGMGDQSQIMPVLLAQDEPGQFARDHYVQAYLQAGVNERTIFHFLWRWLGYAQPWVTLVLHALSAMALIMAWLRISGLFLQRLFFQALVTGLILTLASHFSTGANELYYGSFIPSLPAKALASWGIYAWLRGRFTHWSVLLILAGFIQPLVGLQVMLLTAGGEIVRTVRSRQWSSFPWKPLLGYFVITVPWIWLLAAGNGAGGHNAEFLEIMAFRLSHHFFPGTWSLSSWLITTGLAIWALFAFPGKLKVFLWLIVAGCLLYVVVLAQAPRPVVLYTQWFKTTIWLEAFGLIALARVAERYTYYAKLIRQGGLLIPFALLSGVIAYRLTGWSDSRPPYVFPWHTVAPAEIRISQRANEITPEDAVYVVPYSLTAFRWYGRRSLFVDYKSMLHQYDFLAEWYRRIQLIYQFGHAEKEAGFLFSNFADAVFDEPAYETMALWHQLGITHFISRAEQIDTLAPLAAEPPYYLYAVPLP